MTGAKLLRQNYTGNRQVDDNNRNVDLFASQARRSPFWQGNLMSVTFVANTAQNVLHGLGRAYRGWLVVRLVASSGASVYEPPTATQASALTMVPLEATANCTAAIWFW